MDAAVENVVKLAQARDRAVDDRYVGPKADRHFGSIQSHHAAADHGDFAGKHTRNTAEQHAATAIGLLQRSRASLDREPARNFRHGCKQRQSAMVVRHGLIGNGRASGFNQPLGLFRVGSKMQICV